MLVPIVNHESMVFRFIEPTTVDERINELVGITFPIANDGNIDVLKTTNIALRAVFRSPGPEQFQKSNDASLRLGQATLQPLELDKIDRANLHGYSSELRASMSLAIRCINAAEPISIIRVSSGYELATSFRICSSRVGS